MVLVRSFQVVAIAQQGPDSLSQTVLVGLLGPFIQQIVRDQARVSAVLHILGAHKEQNTALTMFWLQSVQYMQCLYTVKMKKLC